MVIKGISLADKGFSFSRHAINTSHAAKRAANAPQVIKDVVPPAVFVKLGIRHAPLLSRRCESIRSRPGCWFPLRANRKSLRGRSPIPDTTSTWRSGRSEESHGSECVNQAECGYCILLLHRRPSPCESRGLDSTRRSGLRITSSGGAGCREPSPVMQRLHKEKMKIMKRCL